MPENLTNICPLCFSAQCDLFHQDKVRASCLRDYYRCRTCQLVHVPKNQHLDPEQEKAEYDKHQNNPEDEGYRGFLSRVTKPLFSSLSDNSNVTGLDFGCGPGPGISGMAMEQGIKVSNYDLYYFNHPDLLKRQYDFVTITEVIEHIAQPDPLLKRLDSLLKTGAILAIMTKRVSSQEAFKSWHYKSDPTHICFYSIETFEWIAQKMHWRLEIIDKDVVFFHKS